MSSTHKLNNNRPTADESGRFVAAVIANSGDANGQNNRPSRTINHRLKWKWSTRSRFPRPVSRKSRGAASTRTTRPPTGSLIRPVNIRRLLFIPPLPPPPHPPPLHVDGAQDDEKKINQTNLIKTITEGHRPRMGGGGGVQSDSGGSLN